MTKGWPIPVRVTVGLVGESRVEITKGLQVGEEL